MRKAELVEAIAGRLGTKKAAAEAVDALLDTITATVASGEKVTITGFGVFEKVDRPAREARNPATGERITVAAKSVPTFKAGADFKDRVEKGRVEAAA
jgi:DNA-binding protein HU-beta